MLTYYSDWPQSGERQADGRRYASDVHSVPLPDLMPTEICPLCGFALCDHVDAPAVRAAMRERAIRQDAEPTCYVMQGDRGALVYREGASQSISLSDLLAENRVE